MKHLYSAFAVLSLSARSSGFAPGPRLSSTLRDHVVKERKSSSTMSQMSFIDRFLYSAFHPFHCAAPSSSDNIDAMSSSLVTLIGDDLSQEHGDNLKWHESIAASDGCVYGIPNNARRVMKFDPKDNSTKSIGDDLGDGPEKWCGGVEANNGCIYAVPFSEKCILKIDTKRQVVEKINAKLPESNFSGFLWGRGALGDDGCIYFFPRWANRILKLDPSNDTVSSVGDNLQAPQGEMKALFSGTVKADDGCLIGIPGNSNRIMKFNPKEPHTTTMVGEEADEVFDCWSDGALGGDGNIYAVNRFGKILKINVAHNCHSFVAEAPQLTEWGWYSVIAGMDGNIYFPPCHASRVLKLYFSTMQTSLVGDDLGVGPWKFRGGALNPFDGKIYCLPLDADQVLSIDTNTKTQNNDRHNDIQHHGDDDDVKNLVPHIEIHDIINVGGNGGVGRGSQPTMQRLLQVIEVVDRVRGMDHPHPTLTTNVDRMAEAFTVLTDRFLEEILNEK